MASFQVYKRKLIALEIRRDTTTDKIRNLIVSSRLLDRQC